MTAPLNLFDAIAKKVTPPVCVVLGSPRTAAELAARIAQPDTVCYQMDLHQAQRLTEQLAALGVSAQVRVLPDLWDLPQRFQTVLYPAPRRGERELKLDMVEQAQSILDLGGQLIVLSEHVPDSLFGPLLKKIFGKVVAVPHGADGTTFLAVKRAERPRRRHEVIVQGRFEPIGSLRFVTRPGVFTYAQIDNGARALLELVQLQAGMRILDVGCGFGINGIVAGLRAGGATQVSFVDSNVRAVQLTELNARQCGLPDFEVIASQHVAGLRHAPYDAVLTNPPYFAQGEITRLFIERGAALLHPHGSFYLVTKQPISTEPFMVEHFRRFEVLLHRGYHVFVAGQAAASLRTVQDSGDYWP
jgi:16S rRNA G1207 methylase RsmC